MSARDLWGSIPKVRPRSITNTKRIAVYGVFRVKRPATYRQRYWHRRSDRVKQRYWQTVTRPFWRIEKNGRFEFSGRGDKLMKAIMAARGGRVPKGYQQVDAEEFLKNPDLYSEEGEWLDIEVETP